MTKRTLWYAPDLRIKDEPLAKSLFEYRMDEDRWPVDEDFPETANLVASLTDKGTHMPIIDLDFPHVYMPSTSNGHAHLYLDVEMSRFKLYLLLATLAFCGIIEKEHFIWTLRRGATFMRKSDVIKTPEETIKPTYGWFRKLKK